VKLKADVIVRVTGDCPLIDANLVDEVIETFLARDVDYASNIAPPTFPDGLDVEVFRFCGAGTGTPGGDTTGAPGARNTLSA
jgi:spore coat polysaccharide biosynthesis protein SpsF (cytidylyltransferase family)